MPPKNSMAMASGLRSRPKSSPSKRLSAPMSMAKSLAMSVAKSKPKSRLLQGLHSAPARVQSARTRDPNYQCRVDIYDDLRAKCAKDMANCKGTTKEGAPITYADCERMGATAADLLGNFPTEKEQNLRLKALLRDGKNSGDPDKKDWDIGAAKRCLTQLWYGSDEGRTRLDACPPPKRSSRVVPKSRPRSRSGAFAPAPAFAPAFIPRSPSKLSNRGASKAPSKFLQVQQRRSMAGFL